jgi:hypothetical protein
MRVSGEKEETRKRHVEAEDGRLGSMLVEGGVEQMRNE